MGGRADTQGCGRSCQQQQRRPKSRSASTPTPAAPGRTLPHSLRRISAGQPQGSINRHQQLHSPTCSAPTEAAVRGSPHHLYNPAAGKAGGKLLQPPTCSALTKAAVRSGILSSVCSSQMASNASHMTADGGRAQARQLGTAAAIEAGGRAGSRALDPPPAASSPSSYPPLPTLLLPTPHPWPGLHKRRLVLRPARSPRSSLAFTSSSLHLKFCRFCTHSKKDTVTPPPLV